jgi:hypothetical protein
MSKDPKSSYYDQGGIEVLDIIKAKLTAEQYEGYLLGNSLKYSLRLNWKGNKARDAEKAATYSKWFSDAIKELTEIPMADKRVGTSHGSNWKGVTEKEFNSNPKEPCFANWPYRLL